MTGRLVGGEERGRTGRKMSKLESAFLLPRIYSMLSSVHTLDTADVAKGSVCFI